MVLGSLLAFAGAARNSLAYFRSRVSVVGLTLTTPQLAPLVGHLNRLVAGLENAQQVLDQELTRLRRGVIKTPEDEQIIAAFTAATR